MNIDEVFIKFYVHVSIRCLKYKHIYFWVISDVWQVWTGVQMGRKGGEKEVSWSLVDFLIQEICLVAMDNLTVIHIWTFFFLLESSE